MKLSIIIPVFNEEKTVKKMLKKVWDLRISNVEKEIIVVDDGSTDSSAKIISAFAAKKTNFKFIKQQQNKGKGAAVIKGLSSASGAYSIIQDADLEYNPKDIAKIVMPVLEKKVKVVYGTRLKRLPNFEKEERRIRFLIHYLGNKGLSLITSMLYFQWVTDMECCYKLFPTKDVRSFDLKAKGFEFEPEITAKFLKRGYKIDEVSIKTNPRGYDEGKKLNTVRDGLKALFTLLKYRFVE